MEDREECTGTVTPSTLEPLARLARQLPRGIVTDHKTEALRKAAATFADLRMLFHIRGEEKLAAVLGLAEHSAREAIGDSVHPRLPQR